MNNGCINSVLLMEPYALSLIKVKLEIICKNFIQNILYLLGLEIVSDDMSDYGS